MCFFSHQQRIIGVRVPGGEAESDRNVQSIQKLSADHVRYRSKCPAPGIPVVVSQVCGYVRPFAKYNTCRAVQHAVVLQDRQIAVDMLQVFRFVF